MLKNDVGSIDLVQLIIGIIIISIAVIGTTKSFVYGWQTQDWQMRHKKAMCIARSEAEFTQARINTEFDPKKDNIELMLGNEKHPAKMLLDKRDPDIDYDDIYCLVSRSALIPIDDLDNGVGVDYFRFTTKTVWREPNEIEDREVKFEAAASCG